MSDYRVYDGVKKLQRYLNTLTLGVPKLTVDGKFGPKTDTAARTWLGLQPAGTVFPTGLAVAAGLSDADVAEVVAAAGTYGSMVAKGEVPSEGLPTWAWVIIGAGVVAAGVGVYYFATKSKALGELGEFGEGGSGGTGGCGCGG